MNVQKYTLAKYRQKIHTRINYIYFPNHIILFPFWTKLNKKGTFHHSNHFILHFLHVWEDKRHYKNDETWINDQNTCWSDPHELSQSSPESYKKAPYLLKWIHEKVVFLLLWWFDRRAGCRCRGRDGRVSCGFVGTGEHHLIWVKLKLI